MIEGVQGVQCTTVWTGGNGSFAVVPNRRWTTVRDHRDRLRCTNKISKKEQGKCHMLIFTCATSRAVPLEVTKSQRAEEFKEKLNAFNTRRTRPKRIVSDNGLSFQNHCGMNQENPKERSVARLLSEEADYLAVQPV